MRTKAIPHLELGKEYRPGERVVYRGMVLIIEVWTTSMSKATLRLIDKFPNTIILSRCAICRIDPHDCPVMGLKCNSSERSDHKRIYYKFLRMST